MSRGGAAEGQLARTRRSSLALSESGGELRPGGKRTDFKERPRSMTPPVTAREQRLHAQQVID